MNPNAVIKMMTPTTVKRFVEILKTLDYNPKAVTPDPPPHMFRIPEHHATVLIQGDIAEDLGNVSDVDLTQYNVMRYFTVKETRDAGDRLRPIMWPWLNLLRSIYKSAHKLRTVEQYRLLALQQAVALCFDLQASFWQVLLPSSSKLVIVTEDGRILRMKRRIPLRE
jgi:hypothetical protein